MNIMKLIRSVNNINDYTRVTDILRDNYSKLKFPLNRKTVAVLQKFQYLEIEYFRKYYEKGAVLLLFELWLQLPPSKAWDIFGKELITLLQYWLIEIKTYIVLDNSSWWNFMTILLNFVQEIHVKHTSIANLVIQHTAEPLLELTTNSQLNVHQQYHIVKCLNRVCFFTRNEFRYAMKTKLDKYFLMLSSIMANCGDIRLQYTLMETLVRWLPPQHDLRARQEAAAAWFPKDLYSSQAVKIFTEGSWVNFYHYARRFLNAHNATSDSIVAVLCRKFHIGTVVLISTDDPHDYWLDINRSTKCMSLSLTPKLAKALGTPMEPPTFHEALVISEQNTITVLMDKVSTEIQIYFKVVNPLHLYPADILKDHIEVYIAISSRNDLARVDRAMRVIFDEKYQLLMKTDKDLHLVEDSRGSLRPSEYISEEDTRFSIPQDVLLKKQQEQRVSASVLSPKTASTSSQALLRANVSAFPDYKFHKEEGKISGKPLLHNITKIIEPRKRYNVNISLRTAKLGIKGIFNQNKCYSNDRISQRNNTMEKSSSVCNNIVNNDTSKNFHRRQQLNQDIADLQSQDALDATHFKQHSKIPDVNSGVIVDNPVLAKNTNSYNNRKCDIREYKCTIINNTVTTDESNTAFVENTPAVKIKKPESNIKTRVNTEHTKSNDVSIVHPSFNNRTVEEFFAQHFAESGCGDLVVSPHLAKKISSDCMKSINSSMMYPHNSAKGDSNISSKEILECLNNIIDKVCENDVQLAEYSSINSEKKTTSDAYNVDAGHQKSSFTRFIEEDKEEKQNKIINNRKKTNTVKVKLFEGKKQLKFLKPKEKSIPKLQSGKLMDVKVQKKSQNKKGKSKLELVTDKNMSPIIEREILNERTTDEKNSCSELPEKKLDDMKSSVVVRKRKLYSAIDDELVHIKTVMHASNSVEENATSSLPQILKKPPKSKANKEIKKSRKSASQLNAKSKNKGSISSRTEKLNNLFDDLKKTESYGSPDKKICSNNIMIYNFTSSSEDEAFEKNKPINIRDNLGAIAKTRKQSSAKIKNVDSNNNSNDRHNKKIEKRNNPRRLISGEFKYQEVHKEMTDERMRENNIKALNTSIEIEPQDHEVSTEPEPTHRKPSMEIIENQMKIEKQALKKKPNNQKKKTGRIDRQKIVTKNQAIRNVREITLSPLPGLIVEAVEKPKDSDDSVILDRIKGLCAGTNVVDLTHDLMSASEQGRNSLFQLNVTQEIKDVSQDHLCRVDEKNKFGIKKRAKEKRSLAKRESESSPIKISSTKKVKSNKDNSAKNKIVVLNSPETIDTMGKSPITAHGTFNQSPPNSKELNKKIRLRSIETQNLNQPMKNFFYILSKELNSSNCRAQSSNLNTSDSKSKEAGNLNTDKASPNSCKSMNIEVRTPSASKAKVTPIDITTLPTHQYNTKDSKQSSDSEISAKSIRRSTTHTNEGSVALNYAKVVNRLSNISPINLNRIQTAIRKSESSDIHKEFGNIFMKSPVVSLSRLPPETTTMRQTSTYHNVLRKLRTNSEVSTVESKSIKNQKRILNSSPRLNNKRKRTLSDDNFIDNPSNRLTTMDESVEVEGPRYNLRKRSKFETEKVPKTDANELCKPDMNIPISSKSSSSIKLNFETNAADIEDDFESQSPSTRRDNAISRDLKQNKIRLKFQFNKIQNLYKEIQSQESGPSNSSVDEWFKRNERSKIDRRENDSSVSFNETLAYILEKIDTTLSEIDHRTLKRFVTMFVETENELYEMNQKCLEQIRQTAIDITKVMVETLDAKFQELHKKSQEREKEVTTNFKKKARELLREDSKQKRALVNLLREDIQALMDSNSNKNHS